MIAFIEGTIVKKTINTVIISTASGLGYEIFVPMIDLQQLPSNGSRILLYTHLQVKEDAIALFGFLSEEKLQVFKLLITVSGIGPKGALGILSGISLDDLRFAVLSEDTKTISKIPGIGAKTAGKLILELKDKFKLQDTIETKLLQGESVAVGTKASNMREEAVEALATLGYSATEAMKMLRKVEITETTTVEDLIKQGLKNL